MRAASAAGAAYDRAVGDVDDRLHELLLRRRDLPGSIAVMETQDQASRINQELAALEGYVLSLSACWDGELDPIGAFSQLSYLHEKAEGAEQAARDIRIAVEGVAGWGRGRRKG